MVEPMSPRLTSSRLSAPAAAMSASVRSSTANPGRAVRLEEGRLRLEDRRPVPPAPRPCRGRSAPGPADVPVRPQAPQQAGVRVDPDAQRAPFGEPRRVSRVAVRRMSRRTVSSSRHFGASAARTCGRSGSADQAPGRRKMKPGVDLQQAGAGVEHRLTVVAGHDAADADHRQAGAARPGTRRPPGPGRSAAPRTARPVSAARGWSAGTRPSAAQGGVGGDQALRTGVGADAQRLLRAPIGQVGGELDTAPAGRRPPAQASATRTSISSRSVRRPAASADPGVLGLER